MRSKVVSCKHAIREELSKGVFTKILAANVQRAVMMFWGREQDVRLLVIAQYADTLREQTGQLQSPMVVSAYRKRFQKGHQTTLVVAAVAGQWSRSPKKVHRVTLTTRKRSLLK